MLLGTWLRIHGRGWISIFLCKASIQAGLLEMMVVHDALFAEDLAHGLTGQGLI